MSVWDGDARCLACGLVVEYSGDVIDAGAVEWLECDGCGRATRHVGLPQVRPCGYLSSEGVRWAGSVRLRTRFGTLRASAGEGGACSVEYSDGGTWGAGALVPDDELAGWAADRLALAGEWE